MLQLVNGNMPSIWHQSHHQYFLCGKRSNSPQFCVLKPVLAPALAKITISSYRLSKLIFALCVFRGIYFGPITEITVCLCLWAFKKCLGSFFGHAHCVASSRWASRINGLILTRSVNTCPRERRVDGKRSRSVRRNDATSHLYLGEWTLTQDS